MRSLPASFGLLAALVALSTAQIPCKLQRSQRFVSTAVINCVLILYVASHTLGKCLQTYTGIWDVGQPLPLLLTSAMAFKVVEHCVWPV